MAGIADSLQLSSSPLAAGSPPASNYAPSAGSSAAGGNALPSISSSMASPVTGNQPIGQQTYGGVNLTNPALPNPSATPTAAQNAANQANALRLNQGLGVLAGGFNSAQGSIGNAMNVSGQYQNAALGAAANQESNFANSANTAAAGVGLDANLTPLAQRVQGWADQNINEQAASRQAGLLQNQGQLAAQGGTALGNYLGSANIQGPNIQQAASSELQAAQLQALQQASLANQQAGKNNALQQAGNFLNAPPPGLTGPTNAQDQAAAQQQVQQEEASFPGNSGAGQSTGQAPAYDPAAGLGSATPAGTPNTALGTPPSIASALAPTSNPINISPGAAGGLNQGGQGPGQSLAASSLQLPPGTIIDPNTGQLTWA